MALTKEEQQELDLLEALKLVRDNRRIPDLSDKELYAEIWKESIRHYPSIIQRACKFPNCKEDCYFKEKYKCYVYCVLNSSNISK